MLLSVEGLKSMRELVFGSTLPDNDVRRLMATARPPGDGPLRLLSMSQAVCEPGEVPSFLHGQVVDTALAILVGTDIRDRVVSAIEAECEQCTFGRPH